MQLNQLLSSFQPDSERSESPSEGSESVVSEEYYLDVLSVLSGMFTNHGSITLATPMTRMTLMILILV